MAYSSEVMLSLSENLVGFGDVWGVFTELKEDMSQACFCLISQLMTFHAWADFR